MYDYQKQFENESSDSSQDSLEDGDLEDDLMAFEPE